MKTNAKLVELYRSLEAAVQTGDVEFKILVFRNIKVVEPIVYPWIETQKIVNKMIDSYRAEVSKLYREYGEDFGKGYPEVPMFLKKEDGTFDLTKPNPKADEFKAKLSKLEADNEALLEDHRSQADKINSLMESNVSEVVLKELKFMPIDITKHKISDEVNIAPWLEFGIVEIEAEEKEEKKKKVSQ